MVIRMSEKSTIPAQMSAGDCLAAHPIPDRVLDITGEVCPMTFVRTRLALDALASGQVLEVRLQGEEPRRRVPQTALELGHTVLAQVEASGGVLRLLLRRA